jgi:hypothetical protein
MSMKATTSLKFDNFSGVPSQYPNIAPKMQQGIEKVKIVPELDIYGTISL